MYRSDRRQVANATTVGRCGQTSSSARRSLDPNNRHSRECGGSSRDRIAIRLSPHSRLMMFDGIESSGWRGRLPEATCLGRIRGEEVVSPIPVDESLWPKSLFVLNFRVRLFNSRASLRSSQAGSPRTANWGKKNQIQNGERQREKSKTAKLKRVTRSSIHASTEIQRCSSDRRGRSCYGSTNECSHRNRPTSRPGPRDCLLNLP